MREYIRKNKKFIQSFGVICCMLATYVYPIYAAEQEEISVYLNDKEIIFSEDYGIPFIDENNRTQVPFRIVLETFGAKVTWDNVNREAIAEKNNIIVRVPIGEKVIYRNGEMIINDTESIIKNNRTYIPLRVVMEAFGKEVSWNAQLKRIDIDDKVPPSISIELPSTYDLRDYNRVTDVKNQGELGTCWAFAAIGAMESVLLYKGGEMLDFSEDHMSITHGYNITQEGGGDYQIGMSYLARWGGPVYEIDDPYGDGLANYSLESEKHVQESRVLPSKDYDSIKTAIIEYGGVQSSMFIDEQLGKSEVESYSNDNYAYYYDGEGKGNHDVLIIGWDDNYSRENFIKQPKVDGAFLCKNSYGTSFGDNGYFYISYEDTVIGTMNVVYTKIEEFDNYDNIYQADWLGWVGRLGYGFDTAYFSNVYKIRDESEWLRAVSFYTTDIDSTYEVYVVETFNNIEDFEEMELITRGKLEYKGYYTIDFDTPILVKGRFAVVVKIKTEGSTLPVAAEYYNEEETTWISEISIDDGEGYMSADGKEWDRTEEVSNSNVCLKAFTDKVE